QRGVLSRLVCCCTVILQKPTAERPRAGGRQGVRPHCRGPQRGRFFLRNRLKVHQGLIYCAPVKIADTAFVTSSLCFQAARSGNIVKSSAVLPHCASNLVRALSSPGKARYWPAESATSPMPSVACQAANSLAMLG